MIPGSSMYGASDRKLLDDEMIQPLSLVLPQFNSGSKGQSASDSDQISG